MRGHRIGLLGFLAGALATPVHAQQAARRESAVPPVVHGIVEAVFDALQWRSIGPANMGGRVTDVEGIPSPSRTFYVAAASGGIWKTTNNGVTFRPLFQHERTASIGDLAIAPSDTLQIWVGTGEEDARNSVSPGHGVYKSADGGLTWRLMGLEKTEHIGRIVVHPTDPNTVWVAAVGATWRPNPERGLYKTTDGGQTWRRVKFVSERAGFVDLLIHPRDPNILFAASWERLRTPNFLASGGPGSALWKSIDGGETWTEVKGGGFPETIKGRIGIDIARSNPNVIYALVEAEAPDGIVGGCEGLAPRPGGCGLYRSADGGRTWRWMRPEHPRPFYYSQVRVDPADPDRVYWLGLPRLSTDGGQTARYAMRGLHGDHHALWIDPNDPTRMVVGNDGGLGITFDRGGTYWFPNTFPIGQFYAVSFDMAVPYNVCGGLQDNGSWCAPSRTGQRAIGNDMWFLIQGGDGTFTAQDPRDPAIVYSEMQYASEIFRSDLRTGKRTALTTPSFEQRYGMWQDSMALAHPDPTGHPSAPVRARLVAYRRQQLRDSLADQYRYNWVAPFFLSPHNPDIVYMGAHRVLKSTARGDSLHPISPDLSKQDMMKIRAWDYGWEMIGAAMAGNKKWDEIRLAHELRKGGVTPALREAHTYGTITALTESPVRHGLLLAGTDDGNVWLSPNDGATWTDLTPKFRRFVPETTYVSRIEASPHDANRFYVTFDNHRRGDFRPYVLVTHDGGRTFRSLASNLPTDGPDFVHVVREDLVNPQLLFLGTDVGLYVSLDQGGSWCRVGGELPTVPVHDLKIHPRDRELIVATHGRSLWIADIAPLQQLTPQVIASQAPVLFQGAPALQLGSQEPGWPTGHAAFAGDNRSPGADIVYYTPADQATPVRIVITDAQGDTVQTLHAPGRAGLHRVSWDFSYAPVWRARRLSVSQRRDSLLTMRRADLVADSLIAVGMDQELVRRHAAWLKAEQSLVPSSPKAVSDVPGRSVWAERPGEGAIIPLPLPPSPPTPRQAEESAVREAFRMAGVRRIVPGMVSTPRGPADAGTYTVSLVLGDRTYTTRLDILSKERPGMSPIGTERTHRAAWSGENFR